MMGTFLSIFFLASLAVSPVLKTPATSRLFEPVIDPLSGVTTHLLKTDLAQWNAQTLYFTSPTYSADGRFLLFLASDDEFKVRSVPRKIMLIDFLKDEIVDLGIKYDRGPLLDSKTDSLYYFNRMRLMFCRRDLLVDPLKEIDVVAVPKEFGELGKGDSLFTHITLTTDRSKIWCDCHVGSRYFQGLLDIPTGAFEKWAETKFLCNHGQINPVRDDLALCAWECAKFKSVAELTDEERKTVKVDASGVTTNVKRPADWTYPRLQLFVRGKGSPTTIPSTFGNYATHEWWARDGKGFIFCSGGEVIYHDLASGKQRSLCSHGGTHATLTSDNRYVTFDAGFRGSARGKPFAVGLCAAEKDQVVWIRPYTGRYCDDGDQSKIHPDTHPHFSADDRWVVWTWLDPHRMRVAVTEVAPIARRLERMPKRVPAPPRDWKTVDGETAAFLKAHPAGTPLTKEERDAGLALAYEGPRWSKRTVALFERLSADK